MQLSRKHTSDKALIGAGLAVSLLLSSCTYRFSNSFQRGTLTIRTLCVEAIYSTAREVVPYQHIWDEVQKRIAMDGTFYVDDCANADAIVLGHLIDGSVSSTGAVVDPNPIKKDDPSIAEPVNADPKNYRQLERAREVNKNQVVNYQFKVDVQDLHTRNVIFSKVYSRSEQFLTQLPPALIAKKREFPISEEALNSRTRSVGKDFASRLIADLRSNLVRR